MNSLSHAVGSLGVVRRELVRNVRRVGVLGTVQHAATKLRTVLGALVSPRRVTADPFDSKYGTDTALIVSVGALDIPDEQLAHANRYEAVMPEVFEAMVQELPIAHENFIFIDIGSGKGRALLLASLFPFKQIIGVEISTKLAEIAVENVRMYKDDLQACRNIDVVCKDALDYILPDQNVVVFFYNPFDEKLMCVALTNLENFVRLHSRKVYIVYHRPLHRALWDLSQSFKLLKSAEKYVLYESRDVTGAAHLGSKKESK